MQWLADPGGAAPNRIVNQRSTRQCRDGEGRSRQEVERDGRRVVVLHVADGQPVRRGDPLLVLESMKMEHTVTASRDGIVTELKVRVGEQVAPGRRLALIVGAANGDAAPA